MTGTDGTRGGDLTGYRVDCVGGRLGTVVAVSGTSPEQVLTVVAGWWLFSRRLLVSAAGINCIDRSRSRVYLHGTRAQFMPGRRAARRSAVGAWRSWVRAGILPATRVRGAFGRGRTPPASVTGERRT